MREQKRNTGDRRRRWLTGPAPKIRAGAPASAALLGVGLSFTPGGADAADRVRIPGPESGPGAKAADAVRAAPKPLAGRALYVRRGSSAERQAQAWARSRPEDARALRVIASQPTAEWFGDWNDDIAGDVGRVVEDASRSGAVPVLVAYNIPQRDCNQWSAGGSGSPEGYRRWIRDFARGIAGRPAVVVLEPDALPLMDCLTSEGRQTRISLLREAVGVLKEGAGTLVYLDAGHAGWVEAEEMARRLTLAGVQEADGFSLNVSNFLPDAQNTAYGERVSGRTAGSHFIIDSSRNGLGPHPAGEWCNPEGRAIGRLPTTDTDHPLVDAFLWIKRPGESDGACNGGPRAGEWWPEYALGLIRRATHV